MAVYDQAAFDRIWVGQQQLFNPPVPGPVSYAPHLPFTTPIPQENVGCNCGCCGTPPLMTGGGPTNDVTPLVYETPTSMIYGPMDNARRIINLSRKGRIQSIVF